MMQFIVDAVTLSGQNVSESFLKTIVLSLTIYEVADSKDDAVVLFTHAAYSSTSRYTAG